MPLPRRTETVGEDSIECPSRYQPDQRPSTIRLLVERAVAAAHERVGDLAVRPAAPGPESR